MILIERKESKKKANIFAFQGFKNASGQTVRIFPGLNSIDPNIQGVVGKDKNGKSKMGPITESPAWKEMIKCGMHRIISKNEDTEGADTQDISEMKSSDAKKIIKQIHNIDQLKVILTKEQGRNRPRSTVIEAIQDKMNSIRDESTSKKKDEEED